MTLGLLGLLGCAGERPNNLGAHGGALAACPTSPNCVSSQVDDEKHRITPISFSGESETAFARLKLILKQRGDATIIDEKAGYLLVEFRTTLFVDDGEFLLNPEQSTIHVRSASRRGYSDLGKNRSRMEEIRRKFVATGH
jgi:uncharacterized protein (DUF1499 family)